MYKIYQSACRWSLGRSTETPGKGPFKYKVSGVHEIYQHFIENNTTRVLRTHPRPQSGFLRAFPVTSYYRDVVQSARAPFYDHIGKFSHLYLGVVPFLHQVHDG